MLPKPSPTIDTQPCSNLHSTINQSTDASAAEILYDEIEFMDRPKDLEGANFNCLKALINNPTQNDTIWGMGIIFKINSVVTVTFPSFHLPLSL